MNAKLTPNEMLAAIAKLQAENEALKKANERALTIKVSEKGAVSVYGLGRFPVTLYAPQWEKLLGMNDAIKAFIATNRAKLSFEKPAKVVAPAASTGAL